MNKSTPTKKKPIKAHRGRIIYEGRGRPATSKQEQDMRRMLAERQQSNAARQFQRNLQAQRVGNKGMAVTKKAIGENDFRKGGLTLSTVDNRKNK